MKKSILLFTFYLLMKCVSYAQNPNYLLVKREGGTSDDIGQSITTDSNGNILLTGWFSGSITFGATTLTSAGLSDIYIVKYDGLGNVIWAKRAGGAENDMGMTVTSDNIGNIVICGSFNSPSLPFGATILSTSGLMDMFVAKYDANGNVIWAKSAGGNDGEEGASVGIDAGGNIVVTGSFLSPTITFGTTTLTNSGSNDIFVVKYDPNGIVLWAHNPVGAFSEYGRSLSIDGSGNVLVTGQFNSATLTFGTTILTNTGFSDFYLVKYNSTGNIIWATSVSGGIAGFSVASDMNDNIFVTGFYHSSPVTFGTTTLVNSGSDDLFIAKYDANGNAVWATNATGTSGIRGYGIDVDANGNVLTTGIYSGTSNFGSTTLSNAGSSDIFIAKYDVTGNVVWAIGAGGTNTDEGKGVAFDVAGNMLATGSFRSTSMTFGSSTLVNAGNNDIYLITIDGLTGIPESYMNDGMFFSPNPFATTTSLYTNQNYENANLFVFNSLGQTVKVFQNISIGKNNPFQFSRDQLQNGIYFMKLSAGDKIITTTKIIITPESE